MAAKKNFVIDGKKIFACVPKLKKFEMAEIKKYLELGYELIATEPKTETKEEKEAKRKVNPYSRENVEKFLKQKGNEELFAEYDRRYNEQAGTNRTKDGKPIKDEPKFLKDGTPKKKGFANCIGWFRSLYTFDEKANTYISVK